MITTTTISMITMMTIRQFCFISNTDNLGATVDLGILDLCLSGNQEFIMEVVVEKPKIKDFKNLKAMILKYLGDGQNES